MAVTEALALRRPSRASPWPAAGLAAAAAAAVAYSAVRAGGDAAETFALVFTAIVAEALPFVMVGALAAALLEVYVPERTFARIARLPVGFQLPAAAVSGFALPVCECGSVPVARRLVAKGVHPSAAVAFMVASPIFNPIVLGSTWVAYGARGLGLEMVAGRAALGLVVALAAGWALGSAGGSGLVRSGRAAAPAPACPPGGAHGGGRRRARLHALVSAATDDLLYMGKFLIAGAAVAAAFQALVPRAIVAGAAGSLPVAIVALIALAFVSSLCSEADAFVAVSFAGFPLGAQLAFLVFGPVLDLKLFFLYGAAFNRRLPVAVGAVALPVVVAGALWFEAVAA